MVSCRISCKAEGLLIVLEYDTAMTMVDGITEFQQYILFTIMGIRCRISLVDLVIVQSSSLETLLETRLIYVLDVYIDAR